MLRRSRLSCAKKWLSPGYTGVRPGRGRVAGVGAAGYVKQAMQERLRREERAVGSVVVSDPTDSAPERPVPPSSRPALKMLTDDPLAADGDDDDLFAGFSRSAPGVGGDAPGEAEFEGDVAEPDAEDGDIDFDVAPSHEGPRPAAGDEAVDPDDVSDYLQHHRAASVAQGSAVSDAWMAMRGGPEPDTEFRERRGRPADPVAAVARRATGVEEDAPEFSAAAEPSEAPRVPVGQGLALQLDAVNTFDKPLDSVEAFAATQLMHAAASDPEAAAAAARREKLTKLPKHLDKLLKRISGFGVDLDASELDGELRRPPGASDSLAGPAIDTSPGAQPPELQAKAQLRKEEHRVRYGVLMDAAENDTLAKEMGLELLGDKAERAFTNWKGSRIVNSADEAGAELEAAEKTKTAFVATTHHAGMKIPKIGKDSCPGCGAAFHADEEGTPGYAPPEAIAKYIGRFQRAMQLREEYATRMHELQTHWEKHGRRVGEEWLDFMTMDELKAVYHFRAVPMVCKRCTALSARSSAVRRLKGVTQRVLETKDFSKELSALKERRCTIVLVVDATDFPGSMVPDLPGMVSMNNDVIIAVNKIDAVTPWSPYATRPPNSDSEQSAFERRVGRAHIRDWVREQAVRFRLPQERIKGIIPVSSKKGWGVPELIEKIEECSNLLLRPGRPVRPTYFVGCANVGKSSLLNKIAWHMRPDQRPHPNSVRVVSMEVDPETGKEEPKEKWVTDVKKHALDYVNRPTFQALSNMLTTSALPGTTTRTLAVRVNDRGDDKHSTVFYDTPGVHPHWAATSPLSALDVYRLSMDRYRKPTVMVVTPGTTVFMTAYCAVEVVKGPEQLTFFAHCNHKHATCDMAPTERAPDFWRSVAGKTLTPPWSEEAVDDSSRLTVSQTYLFECFNNRRRPKADVYFCGIGWLSFCTVGPADVVLRVRTAPGIVHGVRQPLCTRDMMVFPKWPTSRDTKKVAQGAMKERKRSISQVVELVNDPTKPPGVEVLTPTEMPRGAAPSADPFNALLDDLVADGVLSPDAAREARLPSDDCAEPEAPDSAQRRGDAKPTAD